MTSFPDSETTAPDAVDHRSGRFPGWWVVAGCFTVLLVNSGLAFYGLAVYLNAFSNEKGWALGTISFGVTVFFVVGGVAGLWIARLIARFDVRYIMMAGGVIAGGSLALLGQVETQWQMFLVYAVFAVGYAAAGLVPATTVVTRWFHSKRAVALSVASTGSVRGRHRDHAVREAVHRRIRTVRDHALVGLGLRRRHGARCLVHGQTRSRSDRLGA